MSVIKTKLLGNKTGMGYETCDNVILFTIFYNIHCGYGLNLYHHLNMLIHICVRDGKGAKAISCCLCDAKPKPVSRKFQSNRGSFGPWGCGGGGKLPSAKHPNLPITISFLGGWGGGWVNYQMQMVQTYQLISGGVVVVVVNYEMQMVQTYQQPTDGLCFFGGDDMESGSLSFYGLP